VSQEAELHILHKRVRDLEDNFRLIDRGLTKAEEKLRDKFAIAFVAAGHGPDVVYDMADHMLQVRDSE